MPGVEENSILGRDWEASERAAEEVRRRIIFEQSRDEPLPSAPGMGTAFVLRPPTVSRPVNLEAPAGLSLLEPRNR